MNLSYACAGRGPYTPAAELALAKPLPLLAGERIGSGVLLTDKATGAVEGVMAAPAAERLADVLDRRRQPRPALEIAAVIARLHAAGGVVKNLIARGGANVYVFHDNDLSICPASCGAFFWSQKKCYGGSQSGPRRGFTLGQKALEPLAGNPPGMGRAEAIAPTARAAPDFHALLRDTEQLRDLTGRIVVELELHYALSINFGERRESAARIYRWLLAGQCRKCWGGAASGGAISLKRFRGAA